jgi:hypothetical protein
MRSENVIITPMARALLEGSIGNLKATTEQFPLEYEAALRQALASIDKLYEVATRPSMSDKTEKPSEKFSQYHDLLVTWIAWWNGPGRRDYLGNVLPPLQKTGEVMKCLACSGLHRPVEGGRCEACGRDVSRA